MSETVTPWPKQGRAVDPPRPIQRPCDAGLLAAVWALETQLGTIEAYNRLVGAALALKLRIDAGKAKPQNPLYAVNPKGA